MHKKQIYALITSTILASIITVSAFMPKDTAIYFNGPTVSNITSNSANITLSPAILSNITDEEKSGIYFEYYQTDQVCIAIYPTPAECLPKKTEVRKLEAMLNNLKANTSYTIIYKRDNTIMCIIAPCPSNDFQSLSVEFITKNINPVPLPSDTYITINLGLGSHGLQVITLQEILIRVGHLKTSATAYFGHATRKAVKRFQRDNDIRPTGIVGPLTRAALMATYATNTGEYFEGRITSYSTKCFLDKDCSVTVDNKKVTTTIGRKQGPVGTLSGVNSVADIANKIGFNAKVYAKKDSEGYTLYGDNNYYIKVQ